MQGKILDFGCGIGKLAEFFTKDKYLGVDSDTESIQTARQNYPGFTFSEQLPESGEFDTIIGLAVIEHISSPSDLLKKFAGMLTENGKIILTTPHPTYRIVHDIGSMIGIFSPDRDDHEEFIDHPIMKKLVEGTHLSIHCYERFLFGANQLFVLTRK